MRAPYFLLVITACIFTVTPVAGQDVYKCTQGGRVAYQRAPCAGVVGEQATNQTESQGPAVVLRAENKNLNEAAQKITYERVYAEGLRLFNARCRSSGKLVRDSIKDVSGVRIETVPDNRPFIQRVTDRNWIFAGMPMERVGDRFIASFLDFYFSDNDMGPEFPAYSGGIVLMKGFHYVDVSQKDGTYMRYRLAGKSPSQGMITEARKASVASRYSVTIEPIGTSEERENWVAGSHIKVIDNDTKKLIGELRSFSFALPPKEEGANLQKRFWNIRLSCPKYLDIQDAMTRISLIGIVEPTH